MKVSNHSTVPVYTIAGSSTARPLPEWLARKRKRSLKNDPEYASRVELLQDFEFEEASQCVRVSDDGQWVTSTGTYKPQIHTHYLPHLSLSFARHTLSLNTTFLLLSSDYSKSLHLQADRSLEFHTPLGCHYTTRLPRYGRDLKYNKRSAEALIAAVGVNSEGNGEVFRLNLEAGRYMKAYEVEVGGDDFTSSGGGALQGGIGTGSVNVAALAEDSHNLLAFGTSLGSVEFWDPRSKGRIGVIQSPAQLDLIDGRQEITALEFHRSGLSIATGSSTGLIHLYDLRSPKPVLKKDQGYGYPIQTLIFLDSSTSTRAQTTEPKILSADKRIIKIWDSQHGSPWTSVEPAVDINSVAWCKDSGMILTANEGRQQHSFFIPQLGPAPKWCSFLDNLVEEMAEDPEDPNAFTSQKAGDVYDNYKFLTMSQLESLNLSHLVGTTSLLRPYMHGYFVAQRLYEEAKLIADPFVWEEEKNKRFKDKIDTERESRIRGNKKVTAKVNKRLAEKMLERQEREERRHARKVLEKGGDEDQVNEVDTTIDADEGKSNNLLADPRFAKLFHDEAFAIDERSREFQSLNPSTKPALAEATDRTQRRLTAVEEEALAETSSSSDGSNAGEEQEVPKPKIQDSGRISSTSYKRSGHSSQQPQMRVTSSQQPKQARDRSFGSRAEVKRIAKGNTSTIVGEREITFAPEKQKKEAPKLDSTARRRDKDRRSASGNVFRKEGLDAEDAHQATCFYSSVKIGIYQIAEPNTNMVADAVVYHPTVAHYLRFVATTLGRDKLLRTLQYFSRFYAWYLYRTNNPARVIAPYEAIKKQFGLTRKALRLGKNVEHFKAAAVAADSKGMDPVLKYCSVGRQLGYAMYLSLDAITYLDASGIRPMASAKKLQKEAYRAWFTGLMFNTVAGFYTLWQLRHKEQNIDKSEGEGVVESKKIVQQRTTTNLQLVSDLCDLTIPGAALGYVNLDDGIVGLAGTMSSLIGVWAAWKKTA